MPQDDLTLEPYMKALSESLHSLSDGLQKMVAVEQQNAAILAELHQTVRDGLIGLAANHVQVLEALNELRGHVLRVELRVGLASESASSQGGSIPPKKQGGSGGAVQ